MKPVLSSLSYLLVFAAGVASSAVFDLPAWLSSPQVTDLTLYALLFFVGVVVGSDTQTLSTVRQLGIRSLLLPLVTVVGTSLGVLAVLPLLPGFTPKEVLAVGAGFGYYSLSSIIITAEYSAVLGAIALLSNIVRELFAIVFSPLVARVFGCMAPICAAGATSMDTTLPFVVAASGQRYAILSIYHGVCISIAVPLLTSLSLLL